MSHIEAQPTQNDNSLQEEFRSKAKKIIVETQNNMLNIPFTPWELARYLYRERGNEQPVYISTMIGSRPEDNRPPMLWEIGLGDTELLVQTNEEGLVVNFIPPSFVNTGYADKSSVPASVVNEMFNAYAALLTQLLARLNR